jgi:hypothetical protein
LDITAPNICIPDPAQLAHGMTSAILVKLGSIRVRNKTGGDEPADGAESGGLQDEDSERIRNSFHLQVCGERAVLSGA